MSEKSKNITVNIYGQDYSLKTSADEIYINKIADFVRLKMKEIEETGLDANSQQLKIAVLSALATAFSVKVFARLLILTISAEEQKRFPSFRQAGRITVLPWQP